MLRNFRVGQSNELLFGDRRFDLHNEYDFGGVAITGSGEARTWFVPHPQFAKSPLTVVLIFRGLRSFRATGALLLGRAHDVDEIGYKAQNDEDIDWLDSEKNASDHHDFFIRFEGNEYIRVQCDEAVLLEVQRAWAEVPGL
jgi:hypothetical protein